jgi:hypothetical protein
MRLFGRAPGAVYRVYGEDEYLEGETQPVGLDGRDDSLGGDPRPASRALNLSRPLLAGPRPAALLIATTIVVLAAIAAVLVMNATTHHAANAVAAGAKRSRPVSPPRSRRPPAPYQAQPPRVSRPRPKRAVVHVARASAYTTVRVSTPAVGAAAAPVAVVPMTSSYRSAGSESANALREFGFER